jgi:hypothetical protein
MTTPPPSPLIKRINILNQNIPPNRPTHTAPNVTHSMALEKYHTPPYPPISKVFRAGIQRTLPKRTLFLPNPGTTPTNKRKTLSPPSSPVQHQSQYLRTPHQTNLSSPHPTTPTPPKGLTHAPNFTTPNNTPKKIQLQEQRYPHISPLRLPRRQIPLACTIELTQSDPDRDSYPQTST